MSEAAVQQSGDIPAPAPIVGVGSLGRFVREFVGYIGGRAPVLIGLVVAGALLEGAGLLLLLPVLSVAVGSSAGDEWIGSFTGALLSFVPDASRFQQLLFLIALFAGVLAVRAAVILARDVALAKAQVGFVESKRRQIIRLLTNTRWDRIVRLQHGRITHVLGSDIQGLSDAASMLLTSAVAAAMLAAQCVLVLLLSPVLALLVFGLLLVGALVLRPALRRSRSTGTALTDANLNLITATTQFLGGLKLALSQNLERGFVEGFDRDSSEAGSRRVQFIRQRTSLQLWMTAASAAVAAAVILLGIGLLDAAPSTLIAFLFVLARMNGPGLQLQAGAQSIFYSLPAFEKLKELEAELATAQQSATTRLTRSAEPLDGDIEFRNVSFWHGGQPGAEGAGGLFDVSVVIAQGAFIGLVGSSGAGKTTFADLLVGLFPPMAGEIRVGSRPLDAATTGIWREQVSYVSQETFLFHDTIRNNLLWAQPDANEGEIWEALRLAGAEALVRRSERGLDTTVGDRGGLLSGGERQRIALARALVRRPRLLVLDEATNAIDMMSEREILQRLSSSPNRPTIVMIAHRQSSLELCESLVELHHGHLVS